MQRNIFTRLSIFIAFAQLAGCASQQVQKQLLTQQQTQANLLVQQQAQLAEQQQLLKQLIAHQLEAAEVIENNNVYLTDLVHRKPEIKYIEKIVSQALPAAPVVPQKPTKVTPTSQPKLTLGRVEWLWLDKLQQYVKARVDTGAASSSIHATNEQTFERDGKKCVRFTIGEHKAKKEAANSVPENATIEMPVVRTVRIRQASADGFDRRPVVKLRVRVGQYEDDVEFTLNDRSSMLYPVLLGRTFLRDVAVVDVSRVYMFKPEASKE